MNLSPAAARIFSSFPSSIGYVGGDPLAIQQFDREFLDHLAIQHFDREILARWALCEDSQNQDKAVDVSPQEGVLELIKALSNAGHRWTDQPRAYPLTSGSRSLLDFAFVLQDISIAKALIEGGARVEPEAENGGSLHVLCGGPFDNGIGPWAERLVLAVGAGWEPGHLDARGNNILHIASESTSLEPDRFEEVLDWLEQNGMLDSMINQANNEGFTPLACTPNGGCGIGYSLSRKANMLVDRGADPSVYIASQEMDVATWVSTSKREDEGEVKADGEFDLLRRRMKAMVEAQQLKEQVKASKPSPGRRRF